MRNIPKIAFLAIFQLIVITGQSQIIKTFSGGKTGEINSIAFSPDGKYIASSEDILFDKETRKFSTHGTARLWDIQSGSLIKVFQIPARVGPISFSKDGKHLMAMCAYAKSASNSSDYDSIKVWNVENKRLIETTHWQISNSRRLRPNNRASYSSDGKFYIVGAHPDIIGLFNAESEESLNIYNLPRLSECCGVSALTFSPNDKYISGFLWDNRIAIWLFKNGELELFKILPKPDYFFFSNSLSFSPDEKYLINISRGILFLWDIEKGSLVGTFTADPNQWSWVSTFSPDEKYIASSGQNNSINVWDFKKMLQFDFNELPILSIKENSISFTESSDDNSILNANEEAYLKFTLVNTGPGAAELLEVKSSITGNSNGISIDAGGIPTLEAGKETTVYVSINANMELETGEAKLQITVAEPHGLDAEPIELNLETSSFQPPELVVTDAIFSSEAGGDLKRNYPASLQILVQNLGGGVSKHTRAKVNLPNNVLNMGDSIYTIGDYGVLYPGQVANIEIPFIVTSRYIEQDVPIKIVLSEALEQYGSEKIFTARINQKISLSKLEVKSGEEKSIVTAYLHSDVDRDIPVNLKQSANRFALVIGNEDYQRFQTGLQSNQNVAYARNDASVFKEYLVKTLCYPERQVFLLADATRAQMSRELERITELVKLNPESELVFYYAGHGLPDLETRKGYLVPVDVTASNLSDGISLTDLYAKLASSKASKILVFLDACFSGGGRGENGLLAARTVKIKPRGEIIEGNIVAFTATSGEEISLPLTSESHGLFTYFLLRKFKDTRGALTLEELGKYLAAELPKASLIENGIRQTPQVLVAPDLDEKWLKWQF